MDFAPSSTLSFTVIGGTGIYAGASGSGTLVSIMSIDDSDEMMAADAT